LTKGSPPQRKSLYEKTQGPEAVPIEALIQSGDTAARRASAGYLDFFHARLPSVEALANALFLQPSEDGWKSLYMAVHDLRSSSASAGYQTVSAICESLERLLAERDPQNPLMRDVMKLHLDALSLAVSDKAPNPDNEGSVRLIKNLGRAVDKLPRI
jgi:HPt (histidine-containing phosphotransfer) domain-containing protein